MTKDCTDIIKEYLIEHKYDGLVNIDGPCGCKLDELNVCCNDFAECQPAYIWTGVCKDCDCKSLCGGQDEIPGNYCMRLEKQK